MAWDPALHGVVLFGGGDISGSLDYDTWLWNGSSWRQITTAHSPPARSGAALGYVQGALVLAGGDTRPQLSGWPDVWKFDGTDWSAMTTTGTPPGARFGSAVAVGLAAPNTVVLFGGALDATGSMRDTWLLANGTRWSADGSAGPSLRGAASERASMSAGVGAGFVMLLFGGHGPVKSIADNTGGYLHDTWAFDGVHWRRVA
jgi:hypothetical protein